MEEILRFIPEITLRKYMEEFSDIHLLQEALISIFKKHHHGKVHIGSALQWTQLKPEWQSRGFNIVQFEQLIKHMVAEETLLVHHGYVTFTETALQKGLVSPPTIDESETFIIEYLRFLRLNTGDEIDPNSIYTALIAAGYSEELSAAGIETLVKKEFVERVSDTLRLTAKGFEGF